MSQFDLNQLSKKNQEFIRIAKHQLLENGKSEEEAESLIQEILPAIQEIKEKGFRHGLFLELQPYGLSPSARKNAMKKSILL